MHIGNLVFSEKPIWFVSRIQKYVMKIEQFFRLFDVVSLEKFVYK